MKISVVVPFYNEEGNVDFVLEEIVSTLRPLGHAFEIIAVDDGSQDGTGRLLKKAKAKIAELVVIAQENNTGAAAALWTGFEAVTGDIIIMMDGDRQNDFRDVPRLLPLLDKYDAVFGQRVRRQDPPSKLIATRIAYYVRNFFLGDGVRDTACALKIMKRSVLKYLIPIEGIQRFIPFLLLEAGVPCIAAPVNHRPRSSGESNFSLLRLYFMSTIVDLFFFTWYKHRNLFRIRREALMRSAWSLPGKGQGAGGWTLAALLFLAFCLYGYRLHVPGNPYFDEVHYVRFMRELFAGTYNQYLSVHPPLWHFLTALGMKIFGDHSWAWRLVSVAAGLGIVGMIYVLTRRLTKEHAVALFAVFFWLFDCLSLTQARVAMMNSLWLLFMLASIFFFLDGVDGKKDPDQKRFLFSGLFFSLALATKLVTVSLLFFFLPFWLYYAFSKKAGQARILGWLALYFLVLPLLIFGLVHMAIPFFEGRTLADIWKVTAFHLQYNFTTTQSHPYVSPWWTWPAMVRPVWVSFQAQNSLYEGIFFIGNPVLFWTIPLAIGFVVWEFFRRKTLLSAVILWGFFSQWLFYALGSRFKLFHYFYTAMPFVVMAFALLAWRLWNKGPAGRAVVVIFMLLTLGMFIYWYPLLTALPVSPKFYGHHMWFKSWI